MKGKKSDIFIDLSSIDLDGNILDMGYKGEGVIYKALRKEHNDISDEAAVALDVPASLNEDSWVYGNPSCMPFEENTFDTITVFFSMSYISKRQKLQKTMDEIIRILKNQGKLYIWDMNIHLWNLFVRETIDVKLTHNEIVSVPIMQFPAIKSYNISTLFSAIRGRLKVQDIYDYGKYFFIEASKQEKNLQTKDD